MNPISDIDIQLAQVDLDGICRICLQKSNKPTMLFSEAKESKEILNEIFMCFQIILTPDKYLPSLICCDCIGDLKTASRFRVNCATFEERFSTYCEQNERKPLFCSPEKQIFDDMETKLDDLDDGNHLDGLVIFEPDNIDAEIKSEKHVPEPTYSYMCGVCNKVLKTEASLMKHEKTMHKKRRHIGRVTGYGSSRRYHCTKCPYSTPHSQTLVNHMRRHDGIRPYSCECGKSFTQSSSLASHRRTHSDTTYYTCSVCGKQFKHANAFKTHLRVHEVGSFHCSICQKILKSKHSLQDHIQRHYNIRNFSCEDCGDTFVTSSELLNHRKKHSADKKVECHLCGYKTHRKKNLIIHLKRHAGDKAFKCDLCEVTFYTKGDLQRHQRVHTREKPFSCPTCSQKFTQSTSLNKHMQTVHGIEYKWADLKMKEAKKEKLNNTNSINNVKNEKL